MRIKNKLFVTVRQVRSYLKDYRFSSILIRYFLLLLICLVLPMSALSIWYGNQMQKNLEQEMFKLNEASMDQVHECVNSTILYAKNLSYSLSEADEVHYLGIKEPDDLDLSGKEGSLTQMLAIIRDASKYIESICIYFEKSNTFVTNLGVYNLEEYADKECLEMYSRDMPNRTVFRSRQKNNKYPYLLSVLHPINEGKYNNLGAVIVNIDVEKLGEYIGTGHYRNKNDSPTLLIYDESMENLIYSDEFRLLKKESGFRLEIEKGLEDRFSDVIPVEGKNHIVSGQRSEETGFWYFYLTSMHSFEEQSQTANALMRNVLILVVVVCLILASLLAIWVYTPIQDTIRVLNDVSMLTEWDKKEHVDEMERIQHSIVSAKLENDNLNAQIQERIISLHNAQICALQTQINPHFLYNTLEAIGNAAALLMKGENQITEMIYSLGLLMRISLAGENYLVPLEEEIKHAELYVKLVDFRFRGRVRMHMEIPEELKQEKIVKLTLQPLIENAIEHGLAHKRTEGDIWITGEKKDGKNYLYVIDNGQGASDDRIAMLQESLKENAIGSSIHIGLRNVNQRLKLVFGEEYGLSIDRADRGGLQVSICYKTV